MNFIKLNFQSSHGFLVKSERIIKEVKRLFSFESHQLLTKVCRKIFYENKINLENQNLRNEVLKNIRKVLIVNYQKKLVVSSFGSSSNGFGFNKSDLDVCVVFRETLNKPKKMGLRISSWLKKSRDFENVRFISKARIPIIEFKHKKSQLIGDISLSNHLALFNTDLLKRYSQIDEEVTHFIFAVKYLTKICDISNSKKQYMSSYAYVILCIHFLQQIEALPVLQEIYFGEKKPEKMYENLDVWYFNQIDRLNEIWSLKKDKNSKSGKFLLQFLHFYSEQIDHSVSIATKQKLPKRISSFDVRDPFEVNRFLARNHRCMTKIFQKSKVHFSKLPPSHIDVNDVTALQKFYFDAEVLLTSS